MGDARVAAVLRALPDIPDSVRRAPGDVVERAERHGVGGVVHDALRAAGVALAPEVERELAYREAARELDHEAHLRALAAIDRALAESALPAVVLKGALFAARYYARPSARATTDIDLLVEEALLEHVGAVVAGIGYVAAQGPAEDRYRREHHHLHFSHPSGLPLELHFHAYRGFGTVLPSEPLVARRQVWSDGGFTHVGVLAAEDELVYLAVHAAAHRFVRLGWLYDLRLLVRAMSPVQIAVAAERARRWGYARPLALAAALLVDVLGAERSEVEPMGSLGSVRGRVVEGIVGEPRAAFARSATRFVYTTALCDSLPAAARYAWVASLGRARLLLRAGS